MALLVTMAFTGGIALETHAQKRSFSELQAEAKERAKRRALDAKAVRTKQTKESCRCASPRLLSAPGRVTLDAAGPVAAWLDKSGARVDVFAGKDLTRGFRPQPEATPAPAMTDGGPSPKAPPTPSVAPLTDGEREIGQSFRFTPFPTKDFGNAEPSDAKMVRVWSTKDTADPLLVGLLRKQDRVPRDVVGVKATMGLSEAPLPGKSPELIAAFLGPLEARETAGCGKTVTHRLIANLAEGSEKVAGWLVKRVDAAGKDAVTLVDARQVAVFGVGRVESCGQGLTLSEDDPMTLEIRPVSASFGVGDPWVFQTADPSAPPPTPKTEEEEKKPAIPTLTKAPASQKVGMSNPFVDGFSPKRLSGSKDRVAFGSMAFVVGGAVVVAALWYSVRRRRRRRIEVHGCPACGEEMALDVADPETDGFFCPACGQSTVTVLQTPNGPRVRVYPLGGGPEADAPA